MPFIFERLRTEGIAELSYLLGDNREGVAAVIDPTPDVEKYVELARQKGLSITNIFETHIHAVLVSGALELCARVWLAKIYASGEGDARYGFDPEKIKDGEQFTFRDTVHSVAYCDSGYRASIATSILKQEGFADVSSVPGSWQAWQKAGLPIQGKSE